MKEIFFNMSIAGEDFKSACLDWGKADNPESIVCVHGLTRNSHDFDALARHLNTKYRVICPDIVGRGKSDWLKNKALYNITTYTEQVKNIFTRLELKKADWIGTSMGGLIGMHIAAQVDSPIKRLILNDIGPFIPRQALVDILESLIKADRLFADKSELKAHVKKQYASFGCLTEAQWEHMANCSALTQPDGQYRLAFDPDIRQVFEFLINADIVLWDLWKKITIPVLVLRGEKSGLLLPETAERMESTGPKATVINIPDVGHAPALQDNEQISIITGWLNCDYLHR